MLFLPFKLDADKRAIPLFTVIICIVCSVVYWHQYQQDNAYINSFVTFCTQSLDQQSHKLLADIADQEQGEHCYDIFSRLREADDAEAVMSDMARYARPIGLFPTAQDEFNYYYSRLDTLYRQFERSVPYSLTEELVYDPNELDIIRMVTSTFSHGDIYHLLGNLLFFYIFSAALELIIGSIAYLFYIAVATIVTSLAYSYSMIGVENALPTLGLSGVVMFVIAAMGIMFPAAKIRCLLWIIVYVRILKVPALFLMIWYLGWDIYNMNALGNESNVNYVAHISGAVLGLLVGIYYLLFKRNTILSVEGSL